MNLGTAEASAGEFATGYLAVAELPTGQDEQVPVVVVEGEDPGPTLWVTASIHGDETTGMAVAQDFAARIRDEPLAGTVVCVPVMNPAGVRTNSRTAYYHGDDPNRYFGRDESAVGDPPRVQQRIDERIYEHIAATADALVALHTSWVATHPYVIRPRVPHGDRRSRAEATALRDRLAALTDAFGLPAVNAFGFEEVTERSLRHTLPAAAVVRDGIPAFTPELGGRFVVEEDPRRAAVDGLHNVLHALGAVEDAVTPDVTYSLPFDGPVKRCIHPHTDVAGIVRYRVAEGDRVEAGQAVADVVSPHGTTKRTIETRRSGFVLSRMEGAAVYENDPILDLAVPDDEPLVGTFE